MGFASVAAALGGGADNMLSGCNVAASKTGATFIKALTAATGANIAASRTLPGATELGDDSELQAMVGPVATEFAVSASWRATSPHVLSEFRLSKTKNSGSLVTPRR